MSNIGINKIQLFKIMNLKLLKNEFKNSKSQNHLKLNNSLSNLLL